MAESLSSWHFRTLGSLCPCYLGEAFDIVFCESRGQIEGPGTCRGHISFFCSDFSLNPSISGFKNKTTVLGYFFQISIKNINLIPPDILSMDTGRERVGKRKICWLDEAHLRGAHPDVPRMLEGESSFQVEGTRAWKTCSTARG